MGWHSLLEDALKPVFEQELAPTSKFNLNVALFYASVVHFFASICCFVFYNPDTSRWDYGKLKSPGVPQGYGLPHSVAWMLFHSPSLLIPIVVIGWTRFCHGHALNLLTLLLFAGHYLNRSIVYPLLAKKYAHDTPDRNIPLPLLFAGLLYTSFNGLLQSLSAVSFSYHHEIRGFMYAYAALCHLVGREGSAYFFEASQARAQDVLSAVRYTAGIALFFWGMWTNIISDLILLKLRGTKDFVERCEYSVSLPSTAQKYSSRMIGAHERPDTVCECTFAATQPSKGRTQGTPSRDWKCIPRGTWGSSAACLADDSGLERVDDREVLVPGSMHRSWRCSTSARLQAKSPRAVHYCFTRSPASVYKIPRGKWCDYVSCPNYFGEICEWVGFAIACDTYAAFSFACFTTVFLTRRSLFVHRWYVRTFGKQYPQKRNAIFPGVL